MAKAVGYHQETIVMAISSTLIYSDSTGALPLAERIGMSVDDQIHRRLEPIEPRRHRCIVCELPVQRVVHKLIVRIRSLNNLLYDELRKWSSPGFRVQTGLRDGCAFRSNDLSDKQ